MKTDKAYIIIISVIIAIINLVIIPSLFQRNGIVITIIIELLIVIIAYVVGYHYKGSFLEVKEIGIPQRSVVYIAISFILLNTFIFTNMYQGSLQTEWISRLTPITALLVSIKAALTEEIIFRYCLFTIIITRLNKRFSKNKSFVISSTISSILFSVILHGGSLVSFIGGMVLSFAYYKENIAVAMMIHFVADILPFMYFATINIR